MGRFFAVGEREKLPEADAATSAASLRPRGVRDCGRDGHNAQVTGANVVKWLIRGFPCAISPASLRQASGVRQASGNIPANLDFPLKICVKNQGFCLFLTPPMAASGGRCSANLPLRQGRNRRKSPAARLPPRSPQGHIATSPVGTSGGAAAPRAAHPRAGVSINQSHGGAGDGPRCRPRPCRQRGRSRRGNNGATPRQQRRGACLAPQPGEAGEAGQAGEGRPSPQPTRRVAPRGGRGRREPPGGERRRRPAREGEETKAALEGQLPKAALRAAKSSRTSPTTNFTRTSGCRASRATCPGAWIWR